MVPDTRWLTLTNFPLYSITPSVETLPIGLVLNLSQGAVLSRAAACGHDGKQFYSTGLLSRKHIFSLGYFQVLAEISY